MRRIMLGILNSLVNVVIVCFCMATIWFELR